MATIRIEANTVGSIRAVTKLQAALTPANQEKVIARAAWRVHRGLVERTPKKWTGHTRGGWKVIKKGAAKYTVWNRTKVMVYLEKGTQAHGPTRAKYLFIPLNRKAALAGARIVGNSNFKPGLDYILRKRVRGIRARRIVKRYRRQAQAIVKQEMRDYIRTVLN